MGAVVPGKIEGYQENGTRNRDDNRYPVHSPEVQGVVPWIVALSGPWPGGGGAPALSRRLLRAGGLCGVALAGADPAGTPGLVETQDGRGYKDGAVGACADPDEEGESEVAQG